MRIRKNAKISQLSSISTPPPPSSSSTFLTTHHQLQCQLNQSPWDVITFPIPSQDDSSSPHFQEDEYFGFAGIGSFDDDESIEATHSTSGSKKAVIMRSEETTLKVKNDRKWNSCEVDREDRETSQVGFINVNYEGAAKGNDIEDDVMLCCETNRKGWQCGREVKKGHKVCTRHLRYVTTNVTSSTPAAPRRGRGRPPKKKLKIEPVDHQNPYEFYYYSGFGPLWGKKKGITAPDSVTTGMDHIEIDVTSGTKHEEAKRIEDKEIDYMECDDSEEEEGEEIGKKRGRKRIKARSLKSLM